MRAEIVFLYTELCEFNTRFFERLVDEGYSLVVFHWEDVRLTQYKQPQMEFVKFIGTSKMSVWQIHQILCKCNPKSVYISGWQDYRYLFLVVMLRYGKRGVPVVCGFDDQWHGSVKQVLAKLLGNLKVFQIFFSHAWICAEPQFQYVTNLGFKKTRIIYDLLSCSPRFSEVGQLSDQSHSTRIRNFVYLGRNSPEKGISLLKEAWKSVVTRHADCSLSMIGVDKRSDFNLENASALGYMNEDELLSVLPRFDCIVVPSIRDQWGVVVHEAVSLGLPIICSDSVGARVKFVIHRGNGIVFRSGDVTELVSAIMYMLQASPGQVVSMRELSLLLSKRVNIDTSLANFLSVIGP